MTAFFGARTGFGTSPIVSRGTTDLSAIAAMETAIGRTYGANRWFTTIGKAANEPGTMMADDLAKNRITILSVHPKDASNNLIKWTRITNGEFDAVFSGLAQRLQARGAQVYFTFHAEPDQANYLTNYGTPAEFIAAWRHVQDLMHAQSPNLIKFGFIMVHWDVTADNFWPGDGTNAHPVNFVAADVYNWFGQTTQTWSEFSTIVSPFRTFAAKHPSSFTMITETGCLEDPNDANRKANWFNNMLSYIKTNWTDLRALCYFDYNDTGQPHAWWIDSSQNALNAWTAAGADTFFGRRL